ncbi:hypothetical protein Glove_110g136 [Diversispora epigaea]|uniref:MYND-type domain-containing protein n=1 Tax=Diversispora epigaea TaxID=1348612 RepID=A0A397J1W8_9GLOM|nr:hypothetical protein Glove_110g136 [Diversispora epigaea]
MNENELKTHLQELNQFQEKHPKIFKSSGARNDDYSLIIPLSSTTFSQLSSTDRQELSKIYYNLGKTIFSKENHDQALDYFKACTYLNPLGNKSAYFMMAQIYLKYNNDNIDNNNRNNNIDNNILKAFINILISNALGEISRDNEIFIKIIKKIPFKIPKDIQLINSSNNKISLDPLLFLKDIVLVLPPGTYTLDVSIRDQTIIVIGIGHQVTIKNVTWHTFTGKNSYLVLYNLFVECNDGHNVFLEASKVFIDSCQFIKCSKIQPPIYTSGRESILYLNNCEIANSLDSGGLLISEDSKAIVKNCHIHNIGMNAIEVRYGSSLYAENNNIHNNKQGLIVWLNANHVKLVNNIIRDNKSEGILIDGNREPLESEALNSMTNTTFRDHQQNSYRPPPMAPYTPPKQTTVILCKNKITKNGTFGVSVDYQSSARMEDNEISYSGTSGCIMKGGVDSFLYNNRIHHNRANGVEVGFNYRGKVILENNNIYSNTKQNISEAFEELKKYKFLPQNFRMRKPLTTPVKMVNNKIGSSDEKTFVDFNVSSNRSGTHLFYEKLPSLYAIGNTYGLNLLKDFDFNNFLTQSDQSQISPSSKEISIFLGGIGDLRNLTETVHGFMKSLEHLILDKNNRIDLLFVINDFNPTVIARDLVLLEMIYRLPDPYSNSNSNYFTSITSELSQSSTIYSKWNKYFVNGITHILSVWAEKIIPSDTYQRLISCIEYLINTLESIDSTTSSKSSSSLPFPLWLSFQHSSSNTVPEILKTLKCWKNNSLTPAALNWNTSEQRLFKSMISFSPEKEIVENLMKYYQISQGDEEKIYKTTYCQFPISTNVPQTKDQILASSRYQSSSTSHHQGDEVNVTMLTTPTMEFDVYPTSCIFRAFRIIPDLSKSNSNEIPNLSDEIPKPNERIPNLSDQIPTAPQKNSDFYLYDHLLLSLLPKFASLQTLLHSTHSTTKTSSKEKNNIKIKAKIQIIPIIGDAIDILLCRLSSSTQFNIIDCSNLADFVSLLNLLLVAIPRLKNVKKPNNLFSLQLMKLSGPPPKPMKEFIEERLGVELNILSYLTGITLDNCHYKDFAVYATWNFDITSKLELEPSSKKGKEIDSGSTNLLNHVISIATICCENHNDRIKGLSINTLVRLFQIMLMRFPEKIMSELIYTFIFLEGPTKVPNFINHLVELKTFMSMHLSWWLSNLYQQEKEMALEELRLPVAKYTFIWLVDKDVLSKVNSESAIFIKLIKPTTSSSTNKNRKNPKNKKKNKKNRGKNTPKNDNNNKDQNQPSHYYFDSISLSATESPTLTCSFHLPIAFYESHLDWILEFDKDVLSKVNSESAIFIKLIKPTTSSSTNKNRKNPKNKKKNKKNRGKNTPKNDNNNKDQNQPSHYYFDSISLSATESPTLTCSFHLPIAFYESHLDWILECNIGSITILPSSNKFTLSKVKQTNDKYFDNWIDFLSSQYNNNESGGEYGWNDEKDESIKNIDDITNDSRECKNCKKVFNIKSGGGTCSKCKSVFYCSKICQNQDWKRHKKQDCVIHKS